MDYIIDEKGATYDGLICGTKVKLVTENITVTASAAIPRGAIVTANGSMFNTGDVAYGIPLKRRSSKMAIDLNDTLQMMQVIDRAKAPASFLLDTSELQARDFREFVEGEEIPVVLYEDDNKIHDGGSVRNYDGLSSDNVSLCCA